MLVAILSVPFCLFSGEPNGQCSLRFPPHRDGYCLRISSCPGAVLRSLCPRHASHIGCCILEHSPSPHDRVASNITLKMFTDIFNSTIRSKMLFNYLPRTLNTAKIKSCHQQSAFLTQVLLWNNLSCIILATSYSTGYTFRRFLGDRMQDVERFPTHPCHFPNQVPPEAIYYFWVQTP